MSLSWYSAGRKILKALMVGGRWRRTPTKSKQSISFYMGRRLLEKDNETDFETRCGTPHGKHIFQGQEQCEQRCPDAQRMPGLLGMTLCGFMDCSSPGSSAHGLFPARILKLGVISSSRDLPDPGIKPHVSHVPREHFMQRWAR